MYRIMRSITKFMGRDLEKKRQCQKRYYDKNREKISVWHKLHNEANKERRHAQQKEYRRINKDNISERRKTGLRKLLRSKYNKVYLQKPVGRYCGYKNSARKRDIPFDLSMDDFMAFWQLPCVYCGGDIDTIGLDRKDSSIGYVKSNVVPCCYWCNSMKSDKTILEFIGQCEKIFKFYNS